CLQPITCRSIADLATRVVAPAAHGAAAAQHAGVQHAGADRDCITDAAHRYWHRARGQQAVAELPPATLTPTTNGVVGQERARMVLADDDARDVAEAAHGRKARAVRRHDAVPRFTVRIVA